MTWIFDADVDAQGGAYATGVLVLITSAAIAVTIAARRARQRGWTIGFGVIAAVFLYTTAANVVERPDGVQDRRLLHRRRSSPCRCCPGSGRAFELRVTSVTLDSMAERFIRDTAHRKIRFIANEPDARDLAEYRDKLQQIRADNDIPPEDDIIFVEVTVARPLRVRVRR